MDKSNEHLLLTTQGCIRTRVVRRIPDGDRASYHAEVMGLPLGHVQGQCGDVEERDGQARRTAEAIERSTEERRNASAVKDSDDNDGISTRCQVPGSMPGSSNDHLRRRPPEDEQDVMIDQSMPMDAEAGVSEVVA